MDFTKGWLRACTIGTCLLFLAGCTFGVPPGGSEKRTTSVAELTENFKSIPLRVAVYVAPQVLDAHAVYDNHADVKYPYVVDFARIGPAVAAAVAKNAPLAFEKAYLVSSFPDRRLVGKPIDAVFAIEHVADSRWQSARGKVGWDVSISAGLYSLDGTPIARYSVTASRVPKARTFGAVTPAWIDWEMKNSAAAVRPAVRLMLRRFPRKEVLRSMANYGKGSRDRVAAHRNRSRYWERRRADFVQRIALDRPKLPVSTITLVEYAKLLNSKSPKAKALASAVEGAHTDIAAQQYPGIALAYDRQMRELGISNQADAGLYATQYRTFSAGHDSRKAPLLLQLLRPHNSDR